MTQPIDDRDHRVVQPDGARETDQAERLAHDLSDLIASRYLTPDGEAVATGARGLIYAILALRQASMCATAGAASAIAELDATLAIITDVVVGSVSDAQADGGEALEHHSRAECGV